MDKTCWQRTEQRKGEEREESAKSVRRPLLVRLLQLGCLFRVSQDRPRVLQEPQGSFLALFLSHVTGAIYRAAPGVQLHRVLFDVLH